MKLLEANKRRKTIKGIILQSLRSSLEAPQLVPFTETGTSSSGIQASQIATLIEQNAKLIEQNFMLIEDKGEIQSLLRRERKSRRHLLGAVHMIMRKMHMDPGEIEEMFPLSPSLVGN
ncbi:unnamed protein product [Linum trigynum]|uniref:Uncharacterized protein n=1 Tax=Linum trigynum TaxID=586398 RepID=A0AAV2FPD8_9ROSI